MDLKPATMLADQETKELPVRVMKFGGSSLKDPEHIRKAAHIVVREAGAGARVVVVVSAMGNTTDHLLAMAESLVPCPSPRELDALLSTGEQVTIALMAMAIEALGGKARSFTGWQAGILTEERHGLASIKEIRTQALQLSLNHGQIPVVAGFQGISEENEITTLGRGGSDTTAVALAASLGAQYCDIYTDVDGVYTADPRLFNHAMKLDHIDYEEMLKLANNGCRVLCVQAVALAMQHGVAVRVRSSFAPTDLGTLMCDCAPVTTCGIAC